MAVGKNKKYSTKSVKKKIVDPLTKKDWFDVRVPNTFLCRTIGQTLVNKPVGAEIVTQKLVDRVFESSLSDLQSETDADRSYKKFKFIAEDVQGNHVLTNFYGYSLTGDKVRSMVKKWQTIIETSIDGKTTDDYSLRMFCVAFTDRMPNQVKKTSYCKHRHVRRIKRRMKAIMVRNIQRSSMKDVITKLIPDSIADDIRKSIFTVFPVKDVYITRVRVVKRPQFDMTKLMQLHADVAPEVDPEMGEHVDRPFSFGGWKSQ